MEDKKLTIIFLGSAESIHMLKWAEFFSKRGHEVHLISYASLLDGYDLGNIKIHFIKKIFPINTWPFNTILNMPFILTKVKRLTRDIRPDFINAHYVTSYGSLAALLNFHPLVITAWGSDILVTPKKFLPSKWAVKYDLSKADLVTCDANHMREAMIELGVKDSKIRIINFGIDTKKFSPGVKDKKLKEKLGLANSKIVISLRNLDPIYDIGTFIKSVPLVLKEIPETQFIIIGKGPQEQELRVLSETLGLKNKIKFLGQIPNNKLPEYLRISDVYVSTSLSDGGIAASTAEAMACGLPIIITDVADNKDWVKDNKNGFLIQPKNVAILAGKITCLLKNKNIGKKFGEENRKIIEEKNDYYKEMTKMEEIYRELIITKR